MEDEKLSNEEIFKKAGEAISDMIRGMSQYYPHSCDIFTVEKISDEDFEKFEKDRNE